MRRTLVVSMALFAVVNSPAAAQACLGLPSHSSGQMQVAGNAAFTSLYNSFGASFGYGQPGGVFGKASLGRTSYDGFNGSATDVGAQVGYQLTVGRAAQAQVCPTASLSLGMGPKNIDAGGTDVSGRQGTLGFAIGKVMSSNPRMQIVPNAGLGLAYRKDKLDNGVNPALETSETYGLASVGVGLIFNSSIAVRPSVSIPLGANFSNDPTFGVAVAYNFGTKATPARKR